MNRFLSSFLILVIFPLFVASAQELQGAFRLTDANGEVEAGEEMVIIFSEQYFMFAHYEADGSFIKAGGGSYRINGQQYEQVYDFYTADSSLVRQPQEYNITLKDDKLILSREGERKIYSRIDEGESPLSSAWRFAARVDENGQAGKRRPAGPRQTIKILSGTRFQWAAFNYETKQFSGTGGGTYELSNGTYTETIEFFSRDDSRVGMSLEFNYEIKGNDWHHSGYGSTGKPVNEIWERLP